MRCATVGTTQTRKPKICDIPFRRISVFSVVAAAANYDHNCKYNDPGAVVIKDVA